LYKLIKSRSVTSIDKAYIVTFSITFSFSTYSTGLLHFGKYTPSPSHCFKSLNRTPKHDRYKEIPASMGHDISDVTKFCRISGYIQKLGDIGYLSSQANIKLGSINTGGCNVFKKHH